MKRTLILALGIAVAAVTASAQTNWVSDKAHSNVGFTVTHMVIAEVSGLFRDTDIKVSSTSEDFNGASIEFTAKTGSIDTQNEMRDGHLKSDDFFSAEKYPEIKFSGKLVKSGSTYTAQGKLTLHNVTRDASFNVKYLGTIKTAQFTKAGFKLSGEINRFDYDLKWNKTLETGGLVVGETVQISANIELNQAK
jgi:polyisoprenoid-binding protein YceI